MMATTACPSSVQLQEFALGQASEPLSDELFEHIDRCESCRAKLETVGNLEDSLIGSLRETDELRRFELEPDCRLAIDRALEVLLRTGNVNTDSLLSQLPMTIGEYEVLRPIGRGGMGSVYLARHTKLNREVAIKLLASHRLANPRMRQRFEAEMRAVGTLSHPNVVTAHDAREVDGTAVLVTEYIRGFDLEQIVSRTGPLPLPDACEIVRLTAVALEYISQQGFVHRDIKPSNVMVSETGEVKLLDLGLARWSQSDQERVEMTGTGQTMGTADYVAPEQVSDSRQVDIRADIYSLGCMLFKLLTGFAPFDNEQFTGAFAKMTAHVKEHAPKLSEIRNDLPPRLTRLVDSMLAKSPNDRPQTPMAVAHQLATLAKGCDLAALVTRAQSLPPRVEKPGRVDSLPSTPQTQSWFRRRVPMVVAIASGLFGILIGFVLGVVIKITFPDGTTAEFQVPAGSRIEMGGNESGRTLGLSEAGPAQKDENPLLGGWSLNPGSTLSEDIANPSNRSYLKMLVFTEGRFYMANNDGMMMSGTYLIEPGPEHTQGTIDLEQEYPRSQTLFGLYRIDGEGKAELRLSTDQRPHEFDVKDEQESRLALKRSFSESLAELPERKWLRGSFGMVTAGVIQRIKLADESVGSEELAVLASDSYSPGLAERESATSVTRRNLKELGIGFHYYLDKHKTFPGPKNVRAIVAPGESIYAYSWRIAILPYIGQQELFDQYRFNEPWDSEHNLQLLEKMPEVFKSPLADHDQPPGMTHYLGFSGSATALGNGNGVPIHSFLDGTSNTLLLIETRKAVPWTKPEDLTYPIPEAEPIEPLKAGSINYLTADGAVHELDTSELNRLSDLITRAPEPLSQ